MPDSFTTTTAARFAAIAHLLVVGDLAIHACYSHDGYAQYTETSPINYLLFISFFASSVHLSITSSITLCRPAATLSTQIKRAAGSYSGTHKGYKTGIRQTGKIRGRYVGVPPAADSLLEGFWELKQSLSAYTHFHRASFSRRGGAHIMIMRAAQAGASRLRQNVPEFFEVIDVSHYDEEELE